MGPANGGLQRPEDTRCDKEHIHTFCRMCDNYDIGAKCWQKFRERTGLRSAPGDLPDGRVGRFNRACCRGRHCLFPGGAPCVFTFSPSLMASLFFGRPLVLLLARADRSRAGARLPVGWGTIGATMVANLLGDRTIGSATAFALSNAGKRCWRHGCRDISRSGFTLGSLVTSWDCWWRRSRHRRLGDRRDRGVHKHSITRRCRSHLAAMVRIRRTRHHHGCTAVDRALSTCASRRRAARSSKARGVRRGRDERNCYFCHGSHG